MRIAPLIFPVVCIGIFTPCLSSADEGSTSAPPGYVWCALEHFSGKALIPSGWFCRGIRVPNGSGYQITEEEVVSKSANNPTGATNEPIFFNTSKPIYYDMNRLSGRADYRTGFAIKVFSGPSWNKSSLSKLAEGLFADRKREGRISALLESTIGTYTARSFDREGVEAVGNVVETQHFVERILLDTETPTMIFLTFDCPLSAWPENRDRCEKFFATLSLFQGDKQANHSPYSPHAPATTAAAEATAQAMAADHDPIGTQQSAPDRTIIRMRGPQ
jgi:hypothetical protein